MSEKINLAEMRERVADWRIALILSRREALALITAVEAAQGVLEEYRSPRPGGVVEAVMALDLAVTDRFDFGEPA